jgi:DNA-binding NarL/FixJ family response regulator
LALLPVLKVLQYAHMQKDDLKLKIADLEALLRDRDDTIKQLRAELTEAGDLVDRMREHVEDAGAMIERWIEVFDMEMDDDGVWKWSESKLWDANTALFQSYEKLVSKWNKLVPRYNAAVAPRNMGRPLEASPAQAQEVRKLRKRGTSLREIAKATTLSLQTVRTIVSHGTPSERTRTGELRRVEFDRLAAANWKAKRRGRADLPKRIGSTLKSGAALVKEAKGLGKKQ